MIKRTLYYLPLLLAATLACAKQLEPVTAPEPIVVGPPPRPVQVLQAEIDTLLTDPAFANAHWGVMVGAGFDSRTPSEFREMSESCEVRGPWFAVQRAAFIVQRTSV